MFQVKRVAMSQKPSFQAVPVQRSLWESLEALLMNESKRLVEDIAKKLRQDPKLLWNEIRKEKMTAYMVDCTEPTAESFLCQGFLYKTAVACRCRKPVVFGTTLCPEHQGWIQPTCLDRKPQLRRVELENEVYYLDELTGILYNASYERCGIRQSEKCILFDIEEET
jgi:hypothetical protein